MNPRVRLPHLHSLDISVRTARILTELRIKDLHQLATADRLNVERANGAGPKVLREMVRMCQRALLMPKWIVERSIRLSPLDKAPPGFVALAGPYAQNERWMLELAIASLGSIEWCVVEDASGLTLYRTLNGWKHVAPLTQEEL